MLYCVEPYFTRFSHEKWNTVHEEDVPNNRNVADSIKHVGGVCTGVLSTGSGFFRVVLPCRSASLGPKTLAAFAMSCLVIGKFGIAFRSIADSSVVVEAHPIASCIRRARSACLYSLFV